MNMRVYIKGNPFLQINEKVKNSRNCENLFQIAGRGVAWLTFISTYPEYCMHD